MLQPKAVRFQGDCQETAKTGQLKSLREPLRPLKIEPPLHSNSTDHGIADLKIPWSRFQRIIRHQLEPRPLSRARADARFGSRSILRRLRNVLFSRWGRFLSSDRLRSGTPRTLPRDGALRPQSPPKSR